jgi:hypothetical protein
MTKEILGYKFKEQYLKYQKQAAEIGCYSDRYDVQRYLLSENQFILGDGIKLLKEAGVFDIWLEPVFAPDKPKLPRIDGIQMDDVQMVDNGDKTLTIGQHTKSFDWWEGVAYAMKDGSSLYIGFSMYVNYVEVRTIENYINSQK